MKTKKLMSIIVLVLIIAFAYVSYNISLEQIMFSNKNYSYLGGLTWHRSLDKGFQLSQEKYLFAWEGVPGNDNSRLVAYLNETLGINWVENAKIVKADQDRMITVSAGEKSVNLTLDENKEKAKLTISDGPAIYPTYYLRGKSENGTYNIYQENKPIVVYFWAIWCQYCAGFQAKTLGDPAVKKILEEDYILVAMDLDIDRDVSNRYGVSYPPYVLFLDWNNNVVDRVAGAVDAGTFLPIVTQVRDQVRRK